MEKQVQNTGKVILHRIRGNIWLSKLSDFSAEKTLMYDLQRNR